MTVCVFVCVYACIVTVSECTVCFNKTLSFGKYRIYLVLKTAERLDCLNNSYLILC